MSQKICKIEDQCVANQLKAMGFNYVTEMVNSKTYYCFVHSSEFAKTIMGKFADVRLFLDDHLHF